MESKSNKVSPTLPKRTYILEPGLAFARRYGTRGQSNMSGGSYREKIRWASSASLEWDIMGGELTGDQCQTVRRFGVLALAVYLGRYPCGLRWIFLKPNLPYKSNFQALNLNDQEQKGLTVKSHGEERLRFMLRLHRTQTT